MAVAVATCQHCKQTIPANNLPRHERSCPDNPEVRGAIVAALSDPEHPGYALPGTRYNNRRTFHGAPHAEVLTARYGTWIAVCEEFGLHPAAVSIFKGDNYVSAGTAQCPHCGRMRNTRGLQQHIAHCPERPGVRELVAAAIARPGAPGYAISVSAYRELPAANLPRGDTLVAHFGGWENVAKWCGLVVLDDAAMAEMETARELAEDAAAIAAERERRGLAVARVYMPLRDRRVYCELK